MSAVGLDLQTQSTAAGGITITLTAAQLKQIAAGGTVVVTAGTVSFVLDLMPASLVSVP